MNPSGRLSVDRQLLQQLFPQQLQQLFQRPTPAPTPAPTLPFEAKLEQASCRKDAGGKFFCVKVREKCSDKRAIPLVKHCENCIEDDTRTESCKQCEGITGKMRATLSHEMSKLFSDKKREEAVQRITEIAAVMVV